MSVEKLIDVARGIVKADLLLINGKVVNVFSGEIMETGIVIAGEQIAGLGDYHSGIEIIDLNGSYVLPGLIDSHIHIESSLLTPPAFAAAALPHGTTAIIADPHEIVNVGGLAAWQYMLDSARDLPVDIFYTVPSCVPATHMETAGAVMGASEIETAFDLFPKSPALAELMNYPGLLHKNPGVMDIITRNLAAGKRIDGHAPGLGLNDLNAYIGAGIRSDHECTSITEAQEKMRRGMQVLIREGSCAKNLGELLPLVNADNCACFSFCCDDRHAGDLLAEGEIDAILKKAVALGIAPVQAVRMATINTARHYGLLDRGAVAPGYLADLVVVDNLKEFNVEMVIKSGHVVFSQGNLCCDWPPEKGSSMLNSVHLPDITGRLTVKPPERARLARVIEAVPEQILTRALLLPIEELQSAEVCFAAVIERHGKNGNIGTGFVKGLGLRQGALASTVAHDSHNLIVAGCDELSMELAARTVAEMGGGLAVVADGKVLAALALPVGGLMSPCPAIEVAADYENLETAAKSLGCSLPSPFMALSFLALPVIPELRLTDCGLVDVGLFSLVSPWVT